MAPFVSAFSYCNTTYLGKQGTGRRLAPASSIDKTYKIVENRLRYDKFFHGKTGKEKDSMQFAQNFLLVSSALFLGGMSAYAFMHRKTAGAAEVCLLGVFAVIWTAGSFFEIQAAEPLQKLFWRDVQQLGVFGLPLYTVRFAAAYTMSRRIKQYVWAATVLSVLTVLLIWTNPMHHIMRSGYVLEDSAMFGQTLVVRSTMTGMLLVAYNFSLPLFAILILLNFARKLAPGFRKQVYWIVASFLFTFLAAFVKTAFLEGMGIYIHISVLYIPSAIILFRSLFRFSFFRLSPIARDKVFEVISQGILVMDKDGIVLEANSAALHSVREYFGFQGMLVGSRLHDIFADPDMFPMAKENGEQQREIALCLKTGDAFLSLNFYPLGSHHDGAVMIINNITGQRMYELQLKEQADMDPLTGVMNRSGFEQAYSRMRAVLHDKKQPLSLFMMDLDHFKSINDTFGHAMGDKVLMHFARLLHSSLREEDVIGRIGGDEFAVLLPNLRKADAAKIAERIRKNVDAARLAEEGSQVGYTVSIGIAGDERSDSSLSDVLTQADSALYQAKHQDRNCTVICG
jgi:diguanylate cyclase